ncbi:MAG: methyltransferase [Alteromonadaceae bacterium]|nr:MAG: methyltransferase [Alteromonadaceae bacterium]
MILKHLRTTQSLTVKTLAICSLVFAMQTQAAEKPNDPELQARVKQIMAMKHRDEDDRKRDSNRRPEKALDFFGIKPEMKVIEFAPGGGWYSKILAPLLAESGELHLATGDDMINWMEPARKFKALKKAKHLPIELNWNYQENRYQLDDIDFGMSDADMVLSIREYHNFDSTTKKRLNQAIFTALKPGGLYVVVDHSRRHMQPETEETHRREDPVKVILEIQEAGFELERSSDMFYRADDELRYEVGRRSVSGNTDRFSLVFKKPS